MLYVALHATLPSDQLSAWYAIRRPRGSLKYEKFQRFDSFKFPGSYHAIARVMSSQPSCVFAGFHLEIMGKDLPCSAMKHWAVLGHETQAHVSEDRSCADAMLHELVDDYQAVVVHPFV